MATYCCASACLVFNHSQFASKRSSARPAKSRAEPRPSRSRQSICGFKNRCFAGPNSRRWPSGPNVCRAGFRQAPAHSSPRFLGASRTRERSRHISPRRAGRLPSRPAAVPRPVVGRICGDPSVRLEGPFGHVWDSTAYIEDASLEETQKRSPARFGCDGDTAQAVTELRGRRRRNERGRTRHVRRGGPGPGRPVDFCRHGLQLNSGVGPLITYFAFGCDRRTNQCPRVCAWAAWYCLAMESRGRFAF